MKSLVAHQESLAHTNKFPKMSPKLVDNKLLGLEEGTTESVCAYLLIRICTADKCSVGMPDTA